MPNVGSPVSAALSDDFYEDFERDALLAWTTTGLWHLEDNNTSSWPMYGLPSNSHYMWYGDNETGNYNTTDANSGDLYSDVFNMSVFSDTAYLEFWSWADTESFQGVDIKQVFISPDSGSTWKWLGNITVNGEPRWEFYSYNISSYVSLDSVRLRFHFDTGDELYNDYRGWAIDDVAIVADLGEQFDLWIDQDNNALVGETHSMHFYADSYFSHDMNVSIKIEVIGPTGNVILDEVTNLFFPAYGSWNISKDFTFQVTGYYDVRFSLEDDYAYEWVEWCWWEVNEYGDERFDLWIEQEFYAMVGETKWMDFYAASNYDYSMENLELKIEITGGPYSEELYYNSSISFSAYEVWHLSLNYTFLVEGLYDVSFFLWNDTGLFFEAWCNWEVTPFKEHFELWIDQENFAVVGEMAFMGFNIESSFIHDMTVEVIVEIIDSYENVEVIYHNSSLYFPASSFWYLPLGYSFTSSDYYDVHLILIDDIGAYWDAWCWYEVFDEGGEFLWLDIYQDQHAFVGEDRWMDFVIYSNYSYTFFDVTIEANVLTPSGVEPLFLYENVDLTPYNWWNDYQEYTFKEVGYFEIVFTVTLVDGTSWSHTCGWEITPLEIEIWIDQANYVKIGDVGEMKLSLKNRFPEKTTFGAYFEIKKDGKLMYNVTKDKIVLDPDQEWNEIIAYTFDKLGHWDVYFEVWTSDYSQYWSTDCWWEVQPSDELVSFIDSDRIAQVNVTEDFFVGVYNYFGDHQDFTVEVVVTHPDGTEDTIFNSSVYELGPGEKWKTPLRYTFNYTGHFTVLVAVNNGGYSGSADSFFDVYVEVDTNTTTTTEPPTRSTTISLTPGFELFLIPLVILPIIVSKKRRR